MAKVEEVVEFQIDLAKRIGSLAEILGKIAKAGVNGRAIAAWEEPAKGTALLVVNNPAKTEQALREAGTPFQKTAALAVTTKNTKGSGAKMAKALADAGINITAFRATATGTGNYLTILSTSDNVRAAQALKKV